MYCWQIEYQPKACACPRAVLWMGDSMDWSIIREPDDKLADVRVSLGTKKKLGSYIVFRGEPEEVIQLLEESLLEARRTPQG